MEELPHLFLFSHKSHQMRSVYFLANEVVPYDFFRYLGWICDNDDTRTTRSTTFITIRSGRVRISTTTTTRTCACSTICACYAVTASTTTARSSRSIWFTCTITAATATTTCLVTEVPVIEDAAPSPPTPGVNHYCQHHQRHHRHHLV